MSDRDQLRKRLRTRRDAIPHNDVAAASLAISKAAFTLVGHARHIAAYYAFGAEADPSTLMSALVRAGRRTYVPVVLPQFRMRFAPVDESTPVTHNRYGIKEPVIDVKQLVDASELDAVIVPLVGFDEHCNRMGMGGGYYDRCFEHRQNATSPPLLIGIAFDVQQADNVYAQDWDVPLDAVVTESRILRRTDNR